VSKKTITTKAPTILRGIFGLATIGNTEKKTIQQKALVKNDIVPSTNIYEMMRKARHEPKQTNATAETIKAASIKGLIKPKIVKNASVATFLILFTTLLTLIFTSLGLRAFLF